MINARSKTEVGELRPSQVLMTFGIGSIIDLPNVSVMVMGLDDWQISYASEIGEERLLTSLQKALNAPVTRLLTPAKAPETSGTQLNPFDERAFVGVPVAPFPRWVVACRRCGVKVERLPWAEGKSRLTTTYQWFLAAWSKLLPWQQVADVFHTSWQSVYRSVQMAVGWGLAHRQLDGIQAIGVDEVQWQKGHRYLTLVYQIDGNCRRLLHIAPERTVRSLLSFFRLLGKARSSALKFVCSDRWQPYLKVIAKKAHQAVHVLDRFHIMAKMNKAIDEVRAAEAKRLKRDGYEHILKHSRWCLLKRRENQTEKQAVKLSEVLKYNLQTVRAYLQREDFQRFWEYRPPWWAACFLTEWCDRVMRSRIEPMKKVARTLRSHGELILNWFTAKGTISAGMVEGLNYNVKLNLKKSYGFRTLDAVKTALYHRLGALPEPEFAHRFW